MILYINDNLTRYDYLKVKINKYELTREFEIQIVKEKEDIGFDNVKIYIEKELILSGKIESKQIENNYYTYTGRNNVKYLSDSYTNKKYQIKENVGLETILKIISSEYDIKIEGKGNSLSKSKLELESGKNIGNLIIELGKMFGNYIRSGVEKELIIEDLSVSGEDTQFEYGKNINKKIYYKNEEYRYDKYTVVSNYTKGSYGNGDKEKTIEIDLNLVKTECEKVAKFHYNLDKRKNDNYIIEISDIKKIDINKIYYIVDKDIKKEEAMVTNQIEYIVSDLESKTIARFEEI